MDLHQAILRGRRRVATLGARSNLERVYDRNAVRLALVHMLPDVASEIGARLDPLLRGVGIVGRDGPWDERVVVRAQVCAVLRGLARTTGEALIGFRLGPAARAERLGLSGEALFAGATLRECLALHARHMPDLQRGVGKTVVERDGQAHWVHRMHGADPETAAQLMEGIAAFVVGAVRAILGEPEAKLLVTFPHRPLSPMVRYEDALRCAVAFRAGRDLVIGFYAALLDRPNVLQPLAVFLPLGVSQGETRLAAIVPSEVELGEAELTESLRAIIGAAALGAAPALQEAAGTLGLSPRTLQRRLSGMGVTWGSLVDVWRRETAEAMLADPACRVGTVARRLGYGDPAHFDRAFRRWTGTTPTALRRERVLRRSEAG